MQYAIVTQLKYGKLEIQTTFGSRQKMTLAIFLALKAGLVFFKKAFCFSLKPRQFLMRQKLCHGLTSSQFTYMYVQAICKSSDFLYLKRSSNCAAPLTKPIVVGAKTKPV